MTIKKQTKKKAASGSTPFPQTGFMIPILQIKQMRPEIFIILISITELCFYHLSQFWGPGTHETDITP